MEDVMNVYGKVAIGVFIAGLLIFAFGVLFSQKNRDALTDQQTPTGQIQSQPTANESAPAAQPPIEQPAGR